MPDPTPLGPFLDWLVDFHGYPLTVGDRDRVGRFLRYSGGIKRDMLRSSLATLLTRDPDAYGLFPKHFDEFFPGISCNWFDRDGSWDRGRLLGELHEWQPPDALEGTDRPVSEQQAPSAFTPVSEDEDAAPIPEPPVLYEIRPIPWPPEVPRPWLDYPDVEPQAPPVTLNFEAYPDPKAQSFHLSDVLPPPRRLEDPLLDEVAEAMGYFRSLGQGDDFDVERSIQASIEAGFPVLRFLPGRELGRVLLLEDRQTPSLAWNPVAAELVAGLDCRGIPVIHGRFQGSPAYFQTADHSYEGHLDDWDGDRDSTLLVVVTDGAGLYPVRHRQIVEDLATWPRVAWIDPREEPFWDAGTDLARDQKIPLFEATPRGLHQLADQLLSECGGISSVASRVAVHEDHRVFPQPRALEWAAACAQLPVATPGFAEALRTCFFPELPSHLYGRLLELRGAYWSGTGVYFSEELRRRLEEYYDHSPSVSRSDVHSLLARLLGNYASANRVRIPFDSPAARSREVFQLTFEAGACKDSAGLDRILRRLVPLVGEGALYEAIWKANLKARVESAVQVGDSPTTRALGLSRKPSIPPLPEDLVLIPTGDFLMGDWSEAGYESERPAHRVHVSEFGIGRELVAWELWQKVQKWSEANGYDLAKVGNGAGRRHPVTDVSWYDVLKWCNARSEMEGRQPAYYCDAKRGKLYREGEVDLTPDCVDWSAEGYRLPTEAEWEKAARGGLEKHHFPWPSAGEKYASLVSPERANYDESKKSMTTPVDEYPANGFGLHDMAGNVWQWVWDSWDEKWYRKSDAKESDTRGPERGGKGAFRVIRGGSWVDSARDLRCAFRNWDLPSYRIGYLGFRLASGLAKGKAASEGGAVRRDDDPPSRSERPAPQGCLRVVAPVLTGSQVMVRPVGREMEPMPIKPQQPVPLLPGRWEIEVAALEHSATRLAVTLEPNAAVEVQCQLLPRDFVRIPAGLFQLGDPTTEGYPDERPAHEVEISEFWISRFPVRWDLWQRVAEWARAHGYDLGSEASGHGADHPVVNVTWWDTVKWCNAFSEYVGRRPAYYLDSGHNEVLRSGTPTITAGGVDWRGPGFRLPTEAEWEKAARGGLRGHHYPWPSKGARHESLISPQNANYSASQGGGTTPVDAYPSNRFGLHDMAGNVWQWVWDGWDDHWYTDARATGKDTTGPSESAFRVVRGGSWGGSARDLRCAYRYWFRPSFRIGILGFRLASGQALQASQEVAPQREARRDDEPSAGGAAGKLAQVLAKIRKWGVR